MKRLCKQLLLALMCIGLFGCGIKGEVYEKFPHTTAPQGEVPKDLTIVTTYQDLEKELKNVISNAIPSAKLAVVDYWGDVDMDLKEIIQDITTDDAVGSFALSSVVYEQARALGYQQVSFAIQYKRTEEEIKSIVTATNDREFGQQLMGVFQEWPQQIFLKFATSKSDSEFLQQIYKAYYSQPQHAIGIKNLVISPLKDTRSQQIIEIVPEYLWGKETQVEKQTAVETHTKTVGDQCAAQDVDGKIDYISQYIQGNIQLDQEAMRVVRETSNTQPKSDVYAAYGAYVNGSAAQSGMAMVAKSLCDYLGVENRIVVGNRDGVPHIWMMIKRGEVWQHYDPTVAGEPYIVSSVKLAERYEYNGKIFKVD